MNLTPTGFGVIVAILLVVAIVVTVAEKVRDRREDTPEQAPPAYDTTCARGHYYGRHPRLEATRRVWTCAGCGHEAYVSRADVPYNQTGDVA